MPFCSFQSSLLEAVAARIDFRKIHGKHLYQSHFLNNAAGLRPLKLDGFLLNTKDWRWGLVWLETCYTHSNVTMTTTY